METKMIDCDHLGPYTVTACGEDDDHGYWEETRCNACGYRSTETGMDKPALPW